MVVAIPKGTANHAAPPSKYALTADEGLLATARCLYAQMSNEVPPGRVTLPIGLIEEDFAMRQYPIGPLSQRAHQWRSCQ
jgi:hypothetical protein